MTGRWDDADDDVERDRLTKSAILEVVGVMSLHRGSGQAGLSVKAMTLISVANRARTRHTRRSPGLWRCLWPVMW